jgi:Fe2+ transport system protein FeoA
VQEVEEQLGYPKFDPHGSPIPQRARETTFLTDLRLGEKALVATEQSDDKITSGLWKLGIHPNNLIELSQASSKHLELQTADQLIRIERTLATKVLVVRIN